jgi:hypothetical protein
MFTNANVRLANEVVLSARSTGTTQAALAEGNGASENAYGRPHAPRSGAPKNAALTGLLFDISSTGELRSSAPHRSRISECAPASLRRLDRIKASYRLRIGHSTADQVSQIRGPICSRGRVAHPSHPLPALSVDSDIRRQLAAHCRPKSIQLRSKRRVDSAQTKSIPGPIPRAVHRADFTTLQLASTTTHVPKQLTKDPKRLQRSSNRPQ